MSEISDRIALIREKIAQAAGKSGRNADDVRLLAVSKTFPAADILDAFQNAGQLCFGENKVQELDSKVPVLPAGIEWHLIGHLQSNKAVKAAALAHWIHSVDSEKLIRKLNDAAAKNGKHIKILLEVNMSGEESKSGIRGEDEVFRLAEILSPLEFLEFKGFMTMAECDAGELKIRKTFAALRELRDRVENHFSLQLPELSMGMSGDFEYAIAEGATIVRVGSSIFGHRDYTINA